MTELAVFPIPGSVPFPGAELPLHVFEPRYRQMVHYCLEHHLPLAVCHSHKVLHCAEPSQTVSDALTRNQDTYKPVDICSGGRVELIKTLHDGRLFINVHINKRYQLVEEVQTLPFLIYQAESLPDIQVSFEEAAQLAQLQDKILHRLLALSIDQPEVQVLLRSSQWQQKPAEQFSFELFSLLHLDPERLLDLLRCRSPLERLSQALALLNQLPSSSANPQS